MTVYAKVVTYKTVNPVTALRTDRRYRFEVKDIHVGARVRWPGLEATYIASKDEALARAEQKGYVVVKTWDEAQRREGVYSMEGYYHAMNADECTCVNRELMHPSYRNHPSYSYPEMY